MKKLPILLPLILFLNCAEDQKPINDDQITIGTRDSLFSKILSEQREIWVHIPSSFSGTEKYPVLYLLDGDGHFYSVAGMIKQLSTTNGNTVVPEMVVVGIPNTDRLRDLTPTHVGDSTSTSGGGDNFIKFIRDELMPYIDSKYPTSSYKTLIGHSLGGLMSIHTLMNYPEMFDNYLAIDPSLWWDNRKLFKASLQVLNQQRFDGKALYVGIANTMAKEMDTTRVMSDTTRGTNHIRAILEFSKKAAKIKDNGLNFSWKYYDDEDHGSVPLISEFHALKFFFSWHEFPKWSEILDEDLSTNDLIQLIVGHYKNVSSRFGYQVLPSEGKMNNIGYTLMGRGMNDKAYEIFKLNIENYPASANVYDSMGDYYINQSDTLNAISFFEKAVEIGGIPASKEKLDNLKKATGN